MTTLRRLSTVLRLSTISSYRAPRAFFSRQTVAFRLVAAILLVAALLVHLFPGTQTVLQGSACGDDSFFTNAVDVSGGVTPDSVAVGDFNNDGKQDLAAANVYSHNVSIRLGDGLGGFSDTTNIIVGDAPYSVAIGDF